jgi:plastocyanin
MRNRLLALAGAASVAATLTIAACGGGGPSAPSGGGGGGGGGGNTGTIAATITIGPNGVTPASVTVAPGTRVDFVNSSGSGRNMFSDPHPAHTDCTELNQVGFLSNGQNRATGNLTTVRTCTYHDHDFPDDNRWKGSIRIQ